MDNSISFRATVLTVIWWKHASKSGQYSSAKVHGSLIMHEDGKGGFTLDEKATPGLKAEIIPGF